MNMQQTLPITRTSRLTGITRTRHLPVTTKQLERYFDHGELIQNVFPELTADDREFIMTGVTEDEWNRAFGEEEA